MDWEQAEREHKLVTLGFIDKPRFACSCNQWQMEMPSVGPYGRTSGRAKIARVKMAHGMHIRAIVEGPPKKRVWKNGAHVRP